MILQQMHDLTDEQAIEQFCFNIQWHYALNITSPEDAASYICGKSIWTMRDKLTTEEAYNVIFATTLQRLAEIFKADLSKQRLDSVHLQSNMRHLGRIGLFVKTIKNFLNNLKRQHRNLFDQLDQELIKRYLSKNTESLFASVKPSDSTRTLDQLATDLLTLTDRFSSISTTQNMSTLKQLIRLFKEQCVVEEDKDSLEQKAVARPNKDVPSDSLQNPSDPDAGYSNHKGKGYQAQVVENYVETNDPEEKKKQLSLITYIDIESADKHDAKALLPAIEDLKERGVSPRELLADSLYGSNANCQKAKKGTKACYYRYKDKDVSIAHRRRYEESSAFKDRYRYRAGVEAAMSEFDRRTGVKHLRVRGMRAVRFAAVMKAIGLNIFRASRYRRRSNRPTVPPCGAAPAYLSLFTHVKEQVLRSRRFILIAWTKWVLTGIDQQEIQI